jgi:hypothetical protein
MTDATWQSEQMNPQEPPPATLGQHILVIMGTTAG